MPRTTAQHARTEQVMTSMTPRWARRLDAYADRKEVSRAEALRRLAEAGIEADEAAQNVAVTA